MALDPTMDEGEAHLDRIAQQIADHTALYLRDPEAAHIWDSTVIGIPGPIKTLLLHTTGRVTGREHIVGLQYYLLDGRYVIVASKAGAAEHPHWYRNLVARPECRFQAGLFQSAARARTAEGDERQRLWQAVCDEQPEYPIYQARTEREIPVVVLDLVVG